MTMPVIEVTSRQWRSLFESHYGQQSPPYPEWMYFSTSQSNHFGFAPGLNVDESLVDIRLTEDTFSGRYGFNRFYVRYDPTNGINSHGFVTYQSESL